MTQATFEAVKEFETRARAGYRVMAGGLEGAALAALHDNIRADVVTRATSPRRMQHNETVAGPVAAVMLYVGWKMETDSCTPQYEHMLWTLFSVVRNGGLAMAEMGKTSYAGD